MNKIRSKNHKIGPYEFNKISFSCFDDKIHIPNNEYNHQLPVKTVILITIQNSFFGQAIKM